MPKFRKKPVVIEAEQFLPDEGKIPAGVISDGSGDPRKDARYSWIIPTLEGPHLVSNGDWIITGVKGERYACKPDIFEETYEVAGTGINFAKKFDFGLALCALKAGKRVARSGWNGKGMWLGYIGTYDVSHSLFTNEGERGTLLPWIGMHTADNGFVPWLASQTDMLAEDWSVVE